MQQRRRQWHPTNQKSSLDRRSFVVVPITVSPTGRGGTHNEVRKCGQNTMACWIDVMGVLGNGWMRALCCFGASMAGIAGAVGSLPFQCRRKAFEQGDSTLDTRSDSLGPTKEYRGRITLIPPPEKRLRIGNKFHAIRWLGRSARSEVPDHHGWGRPRLRGSGKPEEHIFR